MPHPRIPRRRTAGLLVGAAIVVVVAGFAAFAGRAPASMSAGSEVPRDSFALLLPPVADPVPWRDVLWQRVADPAGVLGGPLIQSITSVVGGGPGLVAIGDDARGEEGAQNAFGAVWLSVTGADWREVELAAGVRPGDTASAQHVVSGPGGLVITGSVCCTEERAAMWWSADGAAWERIALPDGVAPNGYIQGIAAGPDGYVAVGLTAGRGAIWTSLDGRSWSAVDPEDADLLPGVINGVARASDGWIAVGRIDGRPTYDGGVWTSPDLGHWQRLPDGVPLAGDDEVELSRPVPFAGGIIVVGAQGSAEDRRRCDNLGRAHLAVAGDRLALICGWQYETHFLSRDGQAWERLPDLWPRVPQPLPDPLPARRLISWETMTAGGPGLVVVGSELIGRNDSSNSSALWTSPDGRTWSRVGNADQLPPNESPASIAVVGRTVVAAGQGQFGDGAVWIGTVIP
jgi:hypothetical protein